MSRRAAWLVAVVAACWGTGLAAPQPASAHAGLRRADPPADAVLPAPPTAVRLTFSEEPEPSLSTIRVVDDAGATHEVGPPVPVPGDPSSLTVPVPAATGRAYTVSWQVLSRVDGHTTAGAYAFGVGVAPAAQVVALAAERTTPSPSALEITGRWAFLVGLVLVLGTAIGVGARFAGASRAGVRRLAVGGWALSVVGLAALVEAQRGAADASVAALWATAVGRAAVGRALTLVVAGVGVALLRRGPLGAWTAGAAAAAGMAVHVAAGHAAGSGARLDVAAQWAHFAAAGIWVGGLAALLASVRGAASSDKAAAVRRFSAVALLAVGVVAATGVARAVGELDGWSDLTGTGYGRAVLGKVALLAGMVALGFGNRRRSLPAAASDLGPLRRRSRGEVAIGGAALALAALLAASLPPADARGPAPGIVVSGRDFARSVHLRLALSSPLAGSNRFGVRVLDGAEGVGDVRLRFTALDEPVAATTLALARAGRDYVGTGANLSLDGRWRVVVEVDGDGTTVTVPLEVRMRGPAQFLSVERTPGRPVRYLVEARPGAYIRMHADPARNGVQPVHIRVFDDFGEEPPIEGVVVTTGDADGRARPIAVERVGRGSFTAHMPLHAPRTPVAVVARTVDGTRLRAEVDIEVAED